MARKEQGRRGGAATTPQGVKLAKLSPCHTESPQNTQAPAKSWRDLLPIHPAADLFPLMSPEELKALGEDIKKNGLRVPVVLWGDVSSGQAYLVDGRNRLDAAEAVGLDVSLILHAAKKEPGRLATPREREKFDPYAYVISANIHRRHLTAEQKDDLTAKLLKAKPEASNLAIAKLVKRNDKTVAKVRRELEARSEIPNVEARTDSKGRQQPARRPRHKCWECGVRAPVGEVQQHSYPAYEGVDVWLHDSCVADFEAGEVARAAAAERIRARMLDWVATPEAATTGATTDDIEAEIDPDTRRTAFMRRADQARLFAVYSGPVDAEVCSIAREALAAWTLLVERLTREAAPDDGFGIPPFLRRPLGGGAP
jgi:hypothetical protein